jgi:Putative Ig domain/Dockerin type I domain
MFTSQWRRRVRRNPQGPRPLLRVESLEGRDVPSTSMYGGTVTGSSQSYNHPDSTGAALSGQVSPFQAMAFRVSADDVYTLSNMSSTFPGSDTFLALYSPSFNPSNPLFNLVNVNDNFAPLGLGSQITQALTANTTYILVTSGANSGVTGDVIDKIYSPGTGTITLTTHALPAVDAPTATGVTAGGATLGGTVEGDGGAAVTERGIVYADYSLNSSPKIGGTGVTKVVSGSGLGTFTASVSGLTPGIVYAYRAYATNAVGTFYTSPVMTVTANSPPVLGGITAGDQAVNDNATVKPFLNVTVTDPDVQTETVTVTYTGGNGTFSTLGGFTGSAGSYAFSGTAADVQAALRGLTFVPTKDQVPVAQTVTTAFTVSVSDGIATASDGQTTVIATSINDAPTLANPIPNPTFTGPGVKVLTFAANTFADVDPGTTFTYTAAPVGGGSLPNWLVFNAATRTLSGNPGSTAASPVTIRVTADDGKGGTAYDDVVFTLTNVNDAPVLNPGTPALPGILSTVTPAANTGQLVTTLIGSHVTDSDLGDLKGIAVYGMTVGAGGTWQFTTDGTTWANMPAVSVAAPLLLNSDSNTRIRFVPTADATTTPSITYRAWDRTAGGTEGNLSAVNPGAGGGGSAFSTNSETATVAVTNGKAETVSAVQINDGSAQRSMVSSLTVTFTGPMSFAGGNANASSAFLLTQVGGGTVGLNAAVAANVLGQTVVTLTFQAGSLVQTDGQAQVLSLTDGKYQLTIVGGSMTGTANGLALDGDHDGAAGGNYISPDDTAGSGPGHQLGLYRLFGDVTGDGTVDAFDAGQLRIAFNSSVGSPNYIAALDSDGNGTIDAFDVGAFRVNFNKNLF